MSRVFLEVHYDTDKVLSKLGEINLKARELSRLVSELERIGNEVSSEPEQNEVQ